MLQIDAGRTCKGLTNGRSPFRDRTRNYSLHRSSRLHHSRSSHQLHAAQSKKALSVERWLASAGYAAATSLRQAFSACCTYLRKRGGKADHQRAKIDIRT